jgi:prolipoprotein diacylglyceryltransferase
VIFLERRGKLARGSSIGLYMVLYGTIRYLTELVRTDTTFRLLGVSRNGWVAFLVVLAGAALIVWRQRVGQPQVRVAAPAVSAQQDS